MSKRKESVRRTDSFLFNWYSRKESYVMCLYEQVTSMNSANHCGVGTN